jgi:hypothetical protein
MLSHERDARAYICRLLNRQAESPSRACTCSVDPLSLRPEARSCAAAFRIKAFIKRINGLILR